jgi:hypothetical protein
MSCFAIQSSLSDKYVMRAQKNPRQFHVSTQKPTAKPTWAPLQIWQATRLPESPNDPANPEGQQSSELFFMFSFFYAYQYTTPFGLVKGKVQQNKNKN